MKGQSLVFEQVLLFGFSVAIFIAAVLVFNIYQDYFLSVSHNNQLDEAGELVKSQILKLSQFSDSSNALITLTVPRSINGVYEIRLDQEGIEVENLLTQELSHSQLFSLNETYGLSGSVTSENGKVLIKKEANQITIS